MASKSSKPIQTLVEAEKEAAVVVEKARKNRDARLKQAAAEAEAEINEYRAQKEAQYQAEVEKYKGSAGDVSKKIDEDTEKMIKATSESATQNKQIIVDLLIKYVSEVDA